MTAACRKPDCHVISHRRKSSNQPAYQLSRALQDLQAAAAAAFQSGADHPAGSATSPQPGGQGVALHEGRGDQYDSGGYWDAGRAQQISRNLTQRNHSYFDLAAMGGGGSGGGGGQNFSQGVGQGFDRALSPPQQAQHWTVHPERTRDLAPEEQLAAIMRRPNTDEALTQLAAAHNLDPGHGASSAGPFAQNSFPGLAPPILDTSMVDGHGQQGVISPSVTHNSSLWASMDSEDVSAWIHAGRDSNVGDEASGRPQPRVSVPPPSFLCTCMCRFVTLTAPSQARTLQWCHHQGSINSHRYD